MAANSARSDSTDEVVSQLLSLLKQVFEIIAHVFTFVKACLATQVVLDANGAQSIVVPVEILRGLMNVLPQRPFPDY